MVPLYIGVFIISLSTLMIEISLTRIFSVMIWHHFAFMVISIAMLGFGASGSFLTIFRISRKWDVNRVCMLLSCLFSIGAVIALVIVGSISFDPFQLLDEPINILKMVCIYALFVVPFFLSGLCVSFLLFSVPEKAGQIYFCSLSGSGIGCFMTVYAISLLSNAGAIMFAVFASLVAALIFNAKKSKIGAVVLVGLSLLCIPFVTASESLFHMRPAGSKSMSEFRNAGLKPKITDWNAFSRIDVFEPTNAIYAPGLSAGYPAHKIPRQMMVFIDADANTPITEIKGKKAELDFFKHIPSSLAYQLKEDANVCIIGAGGGFDVLTALATDSPKKITAVELNGDIVDIVAKRVNVFAGNIYNRSNVRVEHAEGRSFIRNYEGVFDIIQISLVDTWAAASRGAYSLAENYLYTTEAFTDYLNRLSTDGILTFTRWLLIPPKECLRLAAIAVSSLEKMGIENPERNIVFVGSGRIAVLLLKKIPFTRSELEKIQAICKRNKFQIIYGPGFARNNVFSKFLLCEKKNAFYAAYPLNIEPPTDDKPFYFHYYTWDKIRFSNFSELFSWYKEDVSYLILVVLLAQAVIFSSFLILVPLLFVRRTKSLRDRRSSPLLLYFACLGLGFIFIEVTLVQKFILFLGHPVYSLSVVISSLLIFAGLGSYLTSRITIGIGFRKSLTAVLISIAGFVLIYSYVLPKLSYAFLGSSLVQRVVISILFLAPLGLIMGMPFPMGLRIASGVNSRLVPWAWGVNGCMSVIGSIMSVMIAMSFGFSVVLQFAAVTYLFAFLIIFQQFLTHDQ
jgi:hypothetical protein